MSKIHGTCCKDFGKSYYVRLCGKTAKVERNSKLYCGLHDPVRVKEKQDARDAKWKAESDARQKRSADSQAAADLQAAKAAAFDWLESSTLLSEVIRDIGSWRVRMIGRPVVMGDSLLAAVQDAMKKEEAMEGCAECGGGGKHLRCHTHGYGCGNQEATCNPKSFRKCPRCSPYRAALGELAKGLGE